MSDTMSVDTITGTEEKESGFTILIKNALQSVRLFIDLDVIEIKFNPGNEI